jgi:hypothetical protein
MGSAKGLGPPVFVVTNTAVRWATTINYDLLLYEDKLVVARGFELRRSVKEELFLRDVVGVERSSAERNEERVRKTAEQQLEELLAADENNRVIRAWEIASASLKHRLGICSLRLTLRTGEKLKYRWMNSASFATKYKPAKEAFLQFLGPRLSV